MSDTHESERAPASPSNVTAERVDDPRFALLDTGPSHEFGLRIDPDTGQVPPPPPPAGPEPSQSPPVVQAPPRPDLGPARRRAGRLVTAALAVPALAAAAIGLALLVSDDSHPAGAAPSLAAAQPAPPPDFTVTPGVHAHVHSGPGIAVAAAGNGGIWYQAPGSDLTRLTANDGAVNYRFASPRPALALGVSGNQVVTLEAAASGEQLVSRDRGSGRVTAHTPLPGNVACSAAAVADCAFVANDDGVWVGMDGGLARLGADGLRMTPLRGVREITAGGRRAWAVAGNQLVTVDAASGAIVHRTSLGAFTPSTMLASGGALWLAGTRPAGPALLRLDVVGRIQRTTPLPAPALSLAAAGGALWLALDGQGVREFDPAAGRLAGSTVAIADPGQLVTARPDQLWAVRQADGRASFTRLDLTPLP